MAVLRIVQLNAGSLFEPEWERRRFEIVSWIDHLQPDVVCLQEIVESESMDNTAGWITEALADEWHWVFGGFPLGPGLHEDPTVQFGSAILSRAPIDAHEVHRLPTASPDSILDRVPWELLHAETAGLDVFSTHLAPAPTHGLHRIRQVLAIDLIITAARSDKDAIGGFGARRETTPAILCGDFNAEPASDEIRFLKGLTPLDGRTTFFQDAWELAGEGPGLTQDWHDNEIAASLNVHRKRIDYVFVGDSFMRANSAGRVLSAELAFHEPRTGVMASDHRGLVVEIHS